MTREHTLHEAITARDGNRESDTHPIAVRNGVTEEPLPADRLLEVLALTAVEVDVQRLTGSGVNPPHRVQDGELAKELGRPLGLGYHDVDLLRAHLPDPRQVRQGFELGDRVVEIHAQLPRDRLGQHLHRAMLHLEQLFLQRPPHEEEDRGEHRQREHRPADDEADPDPGQCPRLGPHLAGGLAFGEHGLLRTAP